MRSSCRRVMRHVRSLLTPRLISASRTPKLLPRSRASHIRKHIKLPTSAQGLHPFHQQFGDEHPIVQRDIIIHLPQNAPLTVYDHREALDAGSTFLPRAQPGARMNRAYRMHARNMTENAPKDTKPIKTIMTMAYCRSQAFSLSICSIYHRQQSDQP